MDLWKNQMCVEESDTCRFAVEIEDESGSLECRQMPASPGYPMVFKGSTGWSENACSYRQRGGE